MPDPRSFVFFFLYACRSCTNSRALSGAIVLRSLFVPPPPSTPMCGDFSKPAETSLTLTENGMKQSGRTRRRALWVECLRKVIRRCPMSASCSWRLCQVTFSSGPPTTLFTYTYCTWRMGRPRVQGKKCSTFLSRNPGGPYRPRCIRRLMVSYFFFKVELCKTDSISENRIWQLEPGSR